MREDEASTPAAFTGRLLPGESIVWRGRPKQGFMLTPRDGFLIPFSLFWGGFAIFWESTALQAKAPFPFALFGVPFVLIGLFMIFGRFVLDAWLRKHIDYALTDRRVLIVRGGPWPSVQAMSLDRLPEATLNEAADGRGTIRFGSQAPMWGNRNGNFGSWIAALDPTPQFLLVEDGRRVFAAVQERAQG